MNSWMRMVLSLSVSGSLLFLAVAGIVKLGRYRLGRTWQYYAWLLVVLRLLVPITTGFNLIGFIFAQAPRTVMLLQPIHGVDSQSEGLTVRMDVSNTAAVQTLDQRRQGNLAGRIHTEQLVWAAWLGTALTLAIRKRIRYQRFVSCVCTGHGAVSDPKLLKGLAVICEDLGIHRRVLLYESRRVPSPLIIGFFKPRIVLPSVSLPQSEIRYILLHELTHFRRGDQLYKWLIQAILCFHWFNPLVYFMARTINRACELACDEAVIRRLGRDEVYEYGHMLIHSLNYQGKSRQTLLGSALRGSATAVKERLEAMMIYKKKSKTEAMVALALTVFLAIGGVALGAFVPDRAIAANGQSATEENLRAIQGDERMTLEGKNIFEYTSGELYALSASDLSVVPERISMGDSDYGDKALGEAPLSINFSIAAAIDVVTTASETDAAKSLEELLSIPLEETDYPVVAVRITDTCAAGPFGIEVGMTVPTLLSLLPDAAETLLNVNTDEFDAVYTARYREADGAAFTIKAYSLMDMVSCCTITRD